MESLELGFFHHLAMHGDIRISLLNDSSHRFERLFLLSRVKQRNARLANQNRGLASGMIRQHANRLAVVLDLAFE